MVVVSIFGGIGNQMFQYAFGRALAHSLNVEFKYDYSYNLIRTDFNPDDIQSIFDLFDLHGIQATESEIKKFRILNKEKNIFKIISLLKRVFNFNRSYIHIIEKNQKFDKSVFNKYTGNLYLSGHWQSEKYFYSIADKIRQDFQFKNIFCEQNIKWSEIINQYNSVSIHLRGRDYISKVETKKQHFTCDLDYYQRSIEFINSIVYDATFFIFSDDPDWAKSYLENIKGYKFIFVTGNEWNRSPISDMYLMSLCKNNIIANSSFSWWAAWLNKNPEKIIISPKKWHNDRNFYALDLIPSNWIKI